MTEHVKVYGIKPRIQYTADGELTTYDFPFVIFKSNDLEAYLGNTKQASNTYTISGVGDSDGGSVTFNEAPASGTIITLIRNLSIERTSDFQEGSTLRSKVLNDELDYQIACTQQIAENLNRSMVLPPYAADSDLDLTLPTPSAGKAIVWNSDGTNLENSTVEVNALESTLKSYKESAESAASTATTKSGIASDKADIATAQANIATAKAEIATEKATEAATILSSKANKDMDNLTQTGKGNIILYGLPDYSSGISVSQGAFTPTTNGLLFIVGNNGINKGVHVYLGSDNTGIDFAYMSVVTGQGGNTLMLPLYKGETYYIANIMSKTNFYPFKGEAA